jgi:hypothetical protein
MSEKNEASASSFDQEFSCLKPDLRQPGNLLSNTTVDCRFSRLIFINAVPHPIVEAVAALPAFPDAAQPGAHSACG